MKPCKPPCPEPWQPHVPGEPQGQRRCVPALRGQRHPARSRGQLALSASLSRSIFAAAGDKGRSPSSFQLRDRRTEHGAHPQGTAKATDQGGKPRPAQRRKAPSAPSRGRGQGPSDCRAARAALGRCCCADGWRAQDTRTLELGGVAPLRPALMHRELGSTLCNNLMEKRIQ